MARLTPIETPDKSKDLITSVTLSPPLVRQLELERVRIGVKSRSDIIKLILEEYFKEEVQ